MKDDINIEEIIKWKRLMIAASKNIADLYESADILYVPMPAFSEEEFIELSKESKEKTDFIIDFNVDLEKVIN